MGGTFAANNFIPLEEAQAVLLHFGITKSVYNKI